ncbi:MAG: FkbM family methyltransferase, partial [Tepidisphaeraceae bacterium]
WGKLFADPGSMYRAYALLRSGRTGGEAAPEHALRLNLRSPRLTLLARPGTDDLAVLLEIFQSGEYRFAPHAIAGPVSTALDLGSNVGFSIEFFNTMYPTARFVGVEPDANNLAMARQNLADLIDAGRVTLCHGFIGARPRVATLARAGQGGSNELQMRELGPDDDDAGIPVVTVGQLIERHGLHRIDLLKCDIEGAERELFDDCGQWIGRVRNLVVELHAELNAQWLCQRLGAAGAKFDLIRWEHRHAGASLAWLRART